MLKLFIENPELLDFALKSGIGLLCAYAAKVIGQINGTLDKMRESIEKLNTQVAVAFEKLEHNEKVNEQTQRDLTDLRRIING